MSDTYHGKYGKQFVREFGYKPGKRKKAVVPWDTRHGWYADHIHVGYEGISQERWDEIFGKKGSSE